MTHKPKVLFLDTVHPVLNKELESLNYECIDLKDLGEIEIPDIIHDYHGIVLRSKIALNKEILSKAKKLKFIARAGAGMENIDVRIFNRWGQEVYFWVGENKSWDGKGADGQDLPEGVYFFIFKADGIDGQYYEEKGSITLLR